MKKAFTLIELLVVVLIIGILAAIALPQYEKAVEKSKAVQALVLLRSAYQAAAAYYMANGEYPNSFADMGFEVPWSGSTKWSTLAGVRDTKSNQEWSLQLYQTATRGLQLYAGRINGDYSGAGFVTQVVENNTGNLSQLNILCVERKTNGISFDETGKAAGSYCAKIMNGTIDPSSTGTYRAYWMP